MSLAVSSRTDQSFTLDPAARTRATAYSPGGGELERLQARAEAGEALTPVEQGTLARLMDGPAARGPRHDPVPSGRAKPHPTPKPDDGIRTIDELKVTGATKQDLADLKQALAYLQQKGPDGKPVSQTATDLLNKLPVGAEIHIVHDGGDQYDPNTKVIDWDPRSGLVVNSGEGTQSAALGLIHEVDHEVAGLRNPKPTGDGYDNTEEKRVITGSETTIAHDLHEPTRTDHGGSLDVMSSSIEHTEVAPKPAEKSFFDRIGDWFRNLF